MPGAFSSPGTDATCGTGAAGAQRERRQVGRSVRVRGVAGVAAFHQRDQFGVSTKERARPDIADSALDDLSPVLAGEQHGVTCLPPVGGHGNGRAVAVGRDQPPHRLRPHERLIDQGDNRGA